MRLLARGGLRALSTAPSVGAAVPITSAQLVASDAAPAEWSGDLLVVPFWQSDDAVVLDGASQALDAALSGALADLIADADFKGKAGSSAVVALQRGLPVRRVAVVGLGDSADFKVAGANKFGAFVARCAKEHKVKTAAALMPTAQAPLQQAALEATLLGLSPDTRFKDRDDDEHKPPPLAELHVLGGAHADTLDRARTVASGVLLARGLVASPANYLTPTAMAAAAAELAAQFGSLELQVLEQAECAARGMGAYLGVSQGAREPPKFIHLRYTPAGGASKKVVLVGKGLTFDSGGYNIKAGAGSMIEKMKFDMGGAGAVLGAARVVAELAPAVEVHFVVAACENMVSSTAMRPGDILTASNGKTIEVLNTDAEGRLTLADALVYAEGLGDVAAIVDVATLTGACVVALGETYAGLWSSHDALAGKLLGAADGSGEPLWRMPLATEYKEQMKSSIADLKNIGERGGGSITAALFLQEFVSKSTPWAHLDIAGPVWDTKADAATGYAVRTLASFVAAVAEEE
jgi:leucyl aminopeptidase